MLEIAVNNEVNTKRLDDGKKKGVHLPSVNDHRVLLCVVDPTTNHKKRDLDVADTRQYDDDKKAEELKFEENPVSVMTLSNIGSNSVNEMAIDSESNDGTVNGANDKDDVTSVSSNQDLQKAIEELDRAEEENEDPDADKQDSNKCKARNRGAKRRKRTTWRGDQNKRKPSKTRPPRSEMSHEDLLKLREKERIAQQLRRERLKRLEENNLEMLKGRTKKTAASKSPAQLSIRQGKERSSSSSRSSSEDSKIESIAESKAGKNTPVLTSLVESNPWDEVKEEDFEKDFGESQSTCDSSFLEAYDSSFSSASPLPNDKRPLNQSPANPKLSYMSALGLQCNMRIPDDACILRTGSYVASLSGRGYSLMQDEGMSAATSATVEFRTTEYDTKSVYSNPYGKKRPVDDNSAQNWSEESSDSSEKKDFSAGQPRRLQRSNLSKEELDRLREKERMAKRKQRAKSKRAFSKDDLEISAPDGETGSNTSICFVSQHESLFDSQNESYNDAKDTEMGVMNEDVPNDDHFKQTSSQAEKSAKDCQPLDGIDSSETSPRSSDGKRVKFGRFYDRSLLTAEELESLRRREREYQRRRRARLREEKFKASGEIQPTKKQADRIPSCSNEEKFVDDSNRKYETRMSKGISRPSLRFLEHSSTSFVESEITDQRDDRECPAGLEWRGAIDRSPLNYKCEMSMVHQADFFTNGQSLPQTDYTGTELPHNARAGDYNYCSNSNDHMIIKTERENVADTVKNSFTDEGVNQKSLNGITDNEKGSAHDFAGAFKVVSKESSNDNEVKRQYQTIDRMYSERPVIVANAVSRRSPLSEALYASDYKILQENGYRCTKSEPDFDSRFYELPGNRRIYHSSWLSQCRPCEQVRCTNGENGNSHADAELNIDSNVETCESDTNKSAKIVTRNDGNQKWRSWKSGLTDSQLQRRRQSNREAQRRRRMRLRLMQMKSVQEQEQISFDEVMYKRFTPNKRMMVNEAIKAFHASKSKLKNMLEKRQKVFMEAQMEKCKNEVDFKVPGNNPPDIRKSRGCRIKVTPKREVVVPTMGFTANGDIVPDKAGPTNGAMSYQAFQPRPSRDLLSYDSSSPFEQIVHHSEDHEKRSVLHYEDLSPPSYEDQTQNTSSRKRKQFCPRRLLSEAERRDHEGLQSVVIAQ
ncbi:enolase-phosphatase E1-like [Rhopilema esculentum]|uniref:enolase-phosphatase E1-like n=1 Tax=Rhopilema esculentum TaxID=499914 RepID=UPI0031E1F66A|eukprot:gene648-10353_t